MKPSVASPAKITPGSQGATARARTAVSLRLASCASQLPSAQKGTWKPKGVSPSSTCIMGSQAVGSTQLSEQRCTAPQPVARPRVPA